MITLTVITLSGFHCIIEYYLCLGCLVTLGTQCWCWDNGDVDIGYQFRFRYRYYCRDNFNVDPMVADGQVGIDYCTPSKDFEKLKHKNAIRHKNRGTPPRFFHYPLYPLKRIWNSQLLIWEDLLNIPKTENIKISFNSDCIFMILLSCAYCCWLS